MSKLSVSRITCPKCKHEQDFEIWESVNAQLNPELRHRLLSRDLFRFKCDRCGNIADAVYPLLYHDMSNKYMIFYALDGMNVPSHPFIEKMMREYNLRKVSSVNQLVEKILLLDTDFDERVMEIFKLVMQQQMGKEDDGKLLFGGMHSDNQEKEALNFVWVTDSGNETYDVPLPAFREFEESIASNLTLQPLDTGEWLTIDRDYVLELMNAAAKDDFD